MGSWGINIFDDDDALDWIYELEQADDLSLIEETLLAVTEQDNEYLERPEASRALAAAEVLAALNGAGDDQLSLEGKNWAAHQKLKNHELIELGLRAILRIKTNSELQDVWVDSRDSEAWFRQIENLETRLERAGND